VVLFSSAHDADAFFTASAQGWPGVLQPAVHLGRKCLEPGGPVSNTNATRSATKTLDNGRTCQWALTVANNVTIDVVACADTPAGAGVNIAQQIAAKVPTT
jgi:hypothetical protein